MTDTPVTYTGETAHEAETQAVNALREAPLETLANILTQDTIPVAGGDYAPYVYGLSPIGKVMTLMSPRWHIALYFDRTGGTSIQASVWVEPDTRPTGQHADETHSLVIYDFQLAVKKEHKGTYLAQWLISTHTVEYRYEDCADPGDLFKTKLGKDAYAEEIYAQRKRHAENRAAYQWENRWDGRTYSAEWGVDGEYWTINPGNKEASE